MIKLKVDSRERTDMIEITDAVKKAVKESGVTSGICLLLFYMHLVSRDLSLMKRVGLPRFQWIFGLMRRFRNIVIFPI